MPPCPHRNRLPCQYSEPIIQNITVVFQPKEANSAKDVIVIANDDILEGSKQFHLRIVAVRLIGEVAALFRAQDGLTITFCRCTYITIADDDCELLDVC